MGTVHGTVGGQLDDDVGSSVPVRRYLHEVDGEGQRRGGTRVTRTRLRHGTEDPFIMETVTLVSVGRGLGTVRGFIFFVYNYLYFLLYLSSY